MPPLPLLVFVVGTGSLGAEIAAVRLLAPYFGASTIVWANTIGIVLVALSIGYWLGGRLADRHPHMRGLCLLALAAASLLALVPFAADPLLDVAVDALDEISAGAFLGSLFAVLVLVAVPVLLLGAVSPYAIRLAVSTVEEAGTVAGRLYALSTAGSLVGTLLSALLLIPLVGTRRTFLIFALAIALMAVWGLRPVRRYALAPAAIAALIALPVGTLKAEAEEGRVIHEAETEYQYARVIEEDDGTRLLELNEGQAQHSVYHPDNVLTGDVWDGHLVLGFAAFDEPPERVAILGNAAGDLARLRGVLPGHARGRRRDRRRAVRDRARVLRHEQPAARALPRGRAPVPAPDRRRVRRDLGRRLPPALHPVLPDDGRVLRERARPAPTGRRADR
jgi:predicted membrane-bound spermidine synthase